MVQNLFGELNSVIHQISHSSKLVLFFSSFASAENTESQSIRIDQAASKAL